MSAKCGRLGTSYPQAVSLDSGTQENAFFMNVLNLDHSGTRFGSGAVTPERNDSMTAVLTSEDTGPTPRRRDRRQRLGDLLAALTRALDSRGDVTTIRGAFEESLR